MDFYLERENGHSRKRASNSCWLKRHQASHLFSAERALKRFFPADTFAALAPVSLLSQVWRILVEVNKPGVAQRCPAQGMHIKADNAYKCK